MQRQEVIQQKLEYWYSASIRALAAEPRALIRGHQLYVKGEPRQLKSPYLQLSLGHQSSNNQNSHTLRGLADGIALRIRHSDHQLHQQLMPTLPVEQLVFELLEQLRVESLAPAGLPGIRSNLRKRFVYWAEQAASSTLTENSIGLLIYSVLVICWSRLLNQSVPEQIEAEIEATRMGLAKTIGHHLYAFKSLTHDQSAFAEHALGIASEISTMADDIRHDSDKRSSDGLEQTLSMLLNASELNKQWLSDEATDWQIANTLPASEDIRFEAEQFEYKIFTTGYDKTVEAKKIIRPAQLKKLRTQLDKKIRRSSINSHRVARYLKSLIASPKSQGWSFGAEQGYVDSARLARLISSPNERRLFRQEAQLPTSNGLISIVVDNSGSMTRHSEVIAELVDTLLKIIDMAGIQSEVLGFTTGEWNGGKAHKDWVTAGKPANPGRLNSLCHIVYKSADTPWRRARPAIAGLLKTDLYKEGIDGEALQWALQRMETRTENKKTILVLSDGSPMDSATHAKNPEHYLDNHLLHVTQKIESRPDLHLCAIGVGLDLSAYYQHHLAITTDKPLSTQDYHQFISLIAGATLS